MRHGVDARDEGFDSNVKTRKRNGTKVIENAKKRGMKCERTNVWVPMPRK